MIPGMKGGVWRWSTSLNILAVVTIKALSSLYDKKLYLSPILSAILTCFWFFSPNNLFVNFIFYQSDASLFSITLCKIFLLFVFFLLIILTFQFQLLYFCFLFLIGLIEMSSLLWCAWTLTFFFFFYLFFLI